MKIALLMAKSDERSIRPVGTHAHAKTIAEARRALHAGTPAVIVDLAQPFPLSDLVDLVLQNRGCTAIQSDLTWERRIRPLGPRAAAFVAPMIRDEERGFERSGEDEPAELSALLTDLASVLLGILDVKTAQRELRMAMMRLALRLGGGNRHACARLLGVDRRYVTKMIQENPELEDAVRASAHVPAGIEAHERA